MTAVYYALQVVCPAASPSRAKVSVISTRSTRSSRSDADDGADLVVACSHGGGIFEELVRSYAMINVMPVALVIPPSHEERSHTGVYTVNGPLASAEDPAMEGIVFADIAPRDPIPTFHYKARHGFYDDQLLPAEPRSLARNTF